MSMIATCLSIVTISIFPATSIFCSLISLSLYIVVVIKKLRFKTLMMVPKDLWIYQSVFVFLSIIANFLISEVTYAVYLQSIYAKPWKLIV